MRVRKYMSALVLAAAIVVTPSSAFADVPPGGGTWDHVLTQPGVSLSIEEHGDVIQVCDTAANGSGAHVNVSSSPAATSTR